MVSDDDSPRPNKRARCDPPTSPLLPSSSLTPPPSSPVASTEVSSGTETQPRPLPPDVLLISLPGLLCHPQNHRFYTQSLYLSLCSLRKCLTLQDLSPEIECRAWTSLAEIGMKIIHGGLHENALHPWASGMELEVEKAISRGSIIAQKHPSLRAYRLHLSLLQIQLAHWQRKTKFSKIQARHLISLLLPSDPAYIVYSAHLAAIALFTSPNMPSNTLTTSSSTSTPLLPSPNCTSSAQDIQAALSAVSDLQALARTKCHPQIILFSHVLRLRILVAANMWADVEASLRFAETGFGLSYTPATTSRPRQGKENVDSNTPQAKEREAARPDMSDSKDEFVSFEDPFESAMAVHTLMMGVVYFTHIGAAAEATPRLSHLHALLDSGALEQFPDGTVQAKIPDGPPLSVQVTHPRILFLLAFLISSVAKRDAVGRRPKRKVFAMEGLKSWEREMGQEITFPLWAGLGDVEEVEQRLARLKADLLCELVAVSIMRSEFDIAEENLNILIAHTRTYLIFPLFAARIALHHAHLAHALHRPARALQCYRVAARLADKGSFVALSAEAGGVVLRLGLADAEGNALDDSRMDRKTVVALVKACRSMGGTLEAVAHIIEALLSSEILKAKQHLKQALELATKAQDNYMRAVVLALIAAHYLHTAGDHALSMLQTCEQLAAGLGAPVVKGSAQGPTGNLRLSLWVGQKYLELYRRAGKDARVQKQIAANQRLEETVNALEVRSTSSDAAAKATVSSPSTS